MLKRTVIISDVHLRVHRVNTIINYEKPDKVVFSGDFFDQFDDSIEETQEMAHWLSANLHNPNYVFLWGNHDTSYAFGNRSARCSGYSQDKAMAISDILRSKDWDKFQWYHWLTDNILITHAGLTKGLAAQEINDNTDVVTIDKVKKLLEKNNEIASINLRTSKNHWFYQAGRSRGGAAYFGGLNWCDIREFVPIEGIMQVFGHTPVKKPVFFDGKYLALDTHNNHYAVFTDKIEIFDYLDIPNY